MCFCSYFFAILLYVHFSNNSIQHYVIKFVSDLRQVSGFLWFPPLIKLTATIWLKFFKSGLKYHNPNTNPGKKWQSKKGQAVAHKALHIHIKLKIEWRMCILVGQAVSVPLICDCIIRLVTNPMTSHERGTEGGGNYDKLNWASQESDRSCICVLRVSNCPLSIIFLLDYGTLCGSLFVLLSLFCWPLCCLPFFDLRLPIISLVSSNFS